MPSVYTITLSERMHLVWADAQGRVYEDQRWQAVGRTGFTYRKHEAFGRWIPLPEGSRLLHLPGRRPLGISPQGRIEVYPRGQAVAAFIAPAHTQLALAAYDREENAPVLSLFAYTAVAWYRGRFYVPAVRIDPQPRQDIRYFPERRIREGAEALRRRFPHNRLVAHLMDNCVARYCCPAARNLALGRWECPLPVSPGCNAACIGCISLQDPAESSLTPPQERINFLPTPEEIAELAIYHLEHAPVPIVSFGQGCEGEPLLAWKVIEEAVRLIRKKTARGIINMNTNGGWPDAVERLARAGLDSFRISLNSAQPEWYSRYYRPRNYTFEEVVESTRRAVALRKWVSFNYFTLPGFTDQPAEYAALLSLLRQTGAHMIQWRNFNIDPDWYAQRIGIAPETLEEPIGVRDMMRQLREKLPHLTYGYYNPHRTFIAKHLESFAQAL